MEDEDEVRRRHGFHRRLRGPCWARSFCTLSYLLFEIISFVALLSIAIGLSVLASLVFEYLFEKRMSTFMQTYVTLYSLLNFGYIMARHHAVYIYPLRHRFGNQAHFFASCKYPWNISFILLVLAYYNLFHQFVRLLCLPENAGRHWRQKISNISGATRNDAVNPQDGKQIGDTTALFLLSLTTVQYLTIRKLQWDYYNEVARLQHVPRFPTCGAYVYAVMLLTGIQMILSVLYSAPILLWLLLSRVFLWSVSTTLLSTALMSIALGSMAAYVERQEPLPNVQHAGMYQIVNLKIRPFVLCLVFIPFISYWFYYAAETACDSNIADDNDLNTLNFFTINVCLCILSTTKFSSLASLARRRRGHIRAENEGHIFNPLGHQVVPEVDHGVPPPIAGIMSENGQSSSSSSSGPHNDATSARRAQQEEPGVAPVTSLSKLKYLWGLRSSLANSSSPVDHARSGPAGNTANDDERNVDRLPNEDTNQNVLTVETAEVALTGSFSTDTLNFGDHDGFACATVPDSTLLETNTVANTGLKQMDTPDVIYTMTTMTVLNENAPSSSGQSQRTEDIVAFTHTGRSEPETTERANSPQVGFEDLVASDNAIHQEELKKSEGADSSN